MSDLRVRILVFVGFVAGVITATTVITAVVFVLAAATQYMADHGVQLS